MAGALAVSESAHCLSGLVLKALEQLVELLHAESLEEPFSVGSIYVRKSNRTSCCFPGDFTYT